MQLNYFQLFKIKPNYNISLEKLRASYYHLQKTVHPDNSLDAKLDAINYSATLNAAYQVLKDPLLRAQYLIKLQNYKLPKLDKDQEMQVLVRQLDWREQLAQFETNNSSLDTVESFKNIVLDAFNLDLGQLQQSFIDNNLTMLAYLLYKLQFTQKLLLQIDELLNNMDL